MSMPSRRHISSSTCAPPSGRIEAARLAGLLHDIGKLAIPNTVLLKTSALTEDEYRLIQLHVERGATIVADLPEFFTINRKETGHNPLANDTITGIRHHHERFDGRGYPDGLAGTDIPKVARAIAVVDVFDALLTTRTPGLSRTILEATAELRRAAGGILDPDMVQAFMTILDTHHEEIDQLSRPDRTASPQQPPMTPILHELEPLNPSSPTAGC